jgi:hypothetical protein
MILGDGRENGLSIDRQDPIDVVGTVDETVSVVPRVGRTDFNKMIGAKKTHGGKGPVWKQIRE